jgi:hypothetical protein
MSTLLPRRAGGALALGLLSFLAPSTAHAEAPPAESVYAGHGPLGSAHVGVVAGAGLPDGVSVGLVARAFRRLGAGVTAAMLPETSLPGLDGARVVRVSGEGHARVYPFGGAFFVGLGLGGMQLKGSMTERTVAFRTEQRAEGRGYASALYVAPQVGFLWLTKIGVAFGCDAGAQIPVAWSEPVFDVDKYGLVVPVEGKGDLAAALRMASSSVMPAVSVRLGFVL